MLHLRFIKGSLHNPSALVLLVTKTLVVISFPPKQLLVVEYAVVAAMQWGITLYATIGHRLSVTYLH